MSSDENGDQGKKSNYRILSVSSKSRRDFGGASQGGSKSVAVEVKRSRSRSFMKKPTGLGDEKPAFKPEDIKKPTEDDFSVSEIKEETQSEKPLIKTKTENKPASAPVKTDSEFDTKQHQRVAKKNTKDEEPDKFKDKLSIKKPSIKSKYEFGMKGGSNKIAVQNIERVEGKQRSFASIKRAREKIRRLKEGEVEKEKQVREVILPEFITVAELASRMAEKSIDVIKECMKLGMIVTANQTIDADTAELVINELGHKLKRVTDADVESILEDNNDNSSEAVKRPPVVTIMGHVDHGKTSLLDAMRDTDVTKGEAGGITQHIGAHQLKVNKENSITFIDTPGHEAFTEMRSRGAKVTDIVILVIAADDGIKEQTIEAINHAKAAEVPIIVAVNKIDKEGADSNKALGELLSHDLIPESMGGDVMTVEVSATQKINLDKLKEAILLQSEMLELTAVNTGKARGVVVESKVEKLRGIAATLLVQKGSLKKGDIVVAGCGYGKVKTIMNDRGMPMKEATPSMPVEVIGLDVAPGAGDTFSVVDEEKQARDICKYRSRKNKEKENVAQSNTSLDELFSRASSDSRVNVLPLIIKGDVQGSIEAIIGSIDKIDNAEIKIKVLHKGVGGINESDIALAKASNAVVIGFNVRANSNAKLLMDQNKVDVRYYAIIYELMDDLKKIASGMLKPIEREQYLGKAEIRKVFNVSKHGKIGGSFVTDGLIKRGAKVRLLRDDVVIHDGQLKTLRRFKDDVKEVSHGYECGIAFEKYDDIKEGDNLEVYEIIEEQQKL
ncbi:MAG: translation initiation factor IF-2 [Alphaproteobacteria bacterium]|nr:translation initiation factor IF-2 [Alphaproteobacteria bacterium]